MSRQNGYDEAIRRAIVDLEKTDLPRRCERLGLPVPPENRFHFQAFGKDLLFNLENFEVLDFKSSQPVHLSEQILFYHYLLYDGIPQPTGNLISFRELPGGQFYWQPYLARTVHILTPAIGNDIQKLSQKVQKFAGEPVKQGDFGYRIRVIGKIEVTLIYYCGDEELAPSANLLYDACIKRVFSTEDVAVLASRICLSLVV